MRVRPHGRPLARSGADLARLGHVALHLLHERVHGLEALLAAHPLQEGDAQRLAVEVALEVDQVRLDQQAAAGLEGGPHPHVHRGGVAVRPGGVDAVAGSHEPVVGHEVGRGHAELAPAPVAAHDLALEQERAAEELGGLRHLAGGHEAADVAGGDRLAGHLHERHHAGLELRAAPAAARASPSAPCPKRKFSPTDTCPAPSRPTSTSSTNASALAGGEVVVEGDHHELLHAQAGDQVALDRRAR